jgi:hypothetical protein
LYLRKKATTPVPIEQHRNFPFSNEPACPPTAGKPVDREGIKGW